MRMQPPNKNRRLVITQHAYQRARQFGLKDGKLITELFWGSVQEKLPKDLRKHARKNHEKYHHCTRYFRNGTYVMVVGEVTHNIQGDDIWLLVTIYDQRLDLPASNIY